MATKIIQLPVGPMANFTYIIADEQNKEAIVIDPSWDLEKIFSILRKNQWKAKFIINTHTHFDHVLGNEQTAALTGAKTIQHKNSNENNHLPVSDGDIISVGNAVLKIIHTPGHSKDSICIILDNKFIFTGDTLFVGNCGRTDLPGGDPGEMYDSLFTKITKLDDNLIVYPGHNYGPSSWSTIGEEKKWNPVLQHRTKEEFLDYMRSPS